MDAEERIPLVHRNGINERKPLCLRLVGEIRLIVRMRRSNLVDEPRVDIARTKVGDPAACLCRRALTPCAVYGERQIMIRDPCT